MLLEWDVMSIIGASGWAGLSVEPDVRTRLARQTASALMREPRTPVSTRGSNVESSAGATLSVCGNLCYCGSRAGELTVAGQVHYEMWSES